MTQKLTVKVTEVLKIHEIACGTWKNTIATYLSRVDKAQNITFTQNEIDDMFSASNTSQLIVLKSIFGKKVAEIDYSKLKTGSKVMIKYTAQQCGTPKIDYDNPVNIVFYKTSHHITASNKFYKENKYNTSYCTFEQNGNFILYSSDKNVDYITEVIEY